MPRGKQHDDCRGGPLPLITIHLATLLVLARQVHADCAPDASQCTFLAGADTYVSSYTSEQELNYGGATYIRLKGDQAIGLLHFDLADLQGRSATGGEIQLYGGDGAVIDVVSTLPVPFVEGSAYYDVEEGASSYLWRTTYEEEWAWEGSTIRDVINGRFDSIRNSIPDEGSTFEVPPDGWGSLALDADLLQELIEGRAHGLVVYAYYVENNYSFYSRDQWGGAAGPFLVVDLETPVESTPPDAPGDLQVSPGEPSGSLSLTWSAPGGDGSDGRAHAYELRVGEQALDTEEGWDAGSALELDMRPAQAGAAESALLQGLEPGSTLYVGLRALDWAGNTSPVVSSGPVVVTEDETGPAAIGDLEALPGQEQGVVYLRWTAPGDDLDEGLVDHYELRWAGEPLDESTFEAASALDAPPSDCAGQAQAWPLRMPEQAWGSTAFLALRAVDDAGSAGPLSESVAVEVPADDSALPVFAAGDDVRFHPVTGDGMEWDSAAYGSAVWDDRRLVNDAWNAAASTIELRAARGAATAFQVVIPGPATGVEVTVSDLGELSSSQQITVYREWFVEWDGSWYPEILVPLVAPEWHPPALAWMPFDVPVSEQSIPDQRFQPIWVDVQVPLDAAAGLHEGTLTVASDAGSVQLAIQLSVLDISLPVELNVDASLNAYGGPDIGFGLDTRVPGECSDCEVYLEVEREVQRMAHRHRATYAPLPYAHDVTFVDQHDAGESTTGFGLPVDGEGSATTISDWSLWDQHFSAYLDGSAFDDLPRAGQPLGHLYLPFHKAWPAQVSESWRWDASCDASSDAPLLAWVDPACDDDSEGCLWTQAMQAVMAEVEDHVLANGWTETDLQIFFNAKKQFGYICADLDEPTTEGDYQTLRFLSESAAAALSGAAPIGLRVDIGHYEYLLTQPEALDGWVDIWVAGENTYDRTRLEARQALGETAWFYGSVAGISSPLTAVVDAAWSAWALAAEGYVFWLVDGWSGDPWASMDGGSGGTVLYYPGLSASAGLEGHYYPFESMRLKAVRRGNQDYELALLLSEARSDRSLADEIITEGRQTLAPEGRFAARMALLSALDPEGVACREAAGGDDTGMDEETASPDDTESSGDSGEIPVDEEDDQVPEERCGCSARMGALAPALWLLTLVGLAMRRRTAEERMR